VASKVLAIGESASHLRWALVELSGVMSLSELGGALVDLLGAEEEAIARAAVDALARIGSTSVVSSIGTRYSSGSRGFRRFALSVLKAIKHDTSEALLCELAESERDPALRGRIFDGLRFHFTERSEMLLRDELTNTSSWIPPEEIQKALHVFSQLRGEGAGLDPGDGEICFRIPFAPMNE
jgi:hypothetical protein